MIRKLKHYVLCTAFTAGFPLTSAAAQEFPIDTATISKAVISETNTYRASKNLPGLQDNALLRAAATAYAKFLAEKEAAGHTADGQNSCEAGSGARVPILFRGGKYVGRVAQARSYERR